MGVSRHDDEITETGSSSRLDFLDQLTTSRGKHDIRSEKSNLGLSEDPVQLPVIPRVSNGEKPETQSDPLMPEPIMSDDASFNQCETRPSDDLERGEKDEVEFQGCLCSRWLASWLRKNEGKDAWLLLLRVFFFNILTGINFIAFALLYVEYSIHFEAGKAALGLIVSIQTSIVSLGGIFLSAPLKRFGCSRVAFVGSVVGAVGLISASFATSVPLLYVTQGVFVGVGFCISSLPSPVIIQKYFSENRVLASGLAMLGFSVGNILGPIVIELLLAQYGWRGCLLILGALMANRAPLGLSFWEPPKQSEVKLPPLPPDDLSERSHSQKNKCFGILKKALNLHLLKDPKFALFTLGVVFQRFFVNSYAFHTASRAIYLGIDFKGAAFISSMIFISNTVTRFIVSFVSNSDRIDRVLQYLVGVVVGITSVLLTIFIGGYKGALIGAIFCGAQLGMTHTIISVILVDLLGVERIAESLGVFNFMIGLIILACIPISGWLYDITGNYDIPFMVMAGSASISAFLVAAVYIVQRREGKQKKQEPDIPPLSLQAKHLFVSETSVNI